MGEQLRLSIVVPAFNEAARIIDEGERLHRAVTAGVVDPGSTELIVVDDGSSDDTAHRSAVEFGRSFPEIRVLRRIVNSGKGAAIRDGVALARAPVVLFMDADMAVDPLQIPLLDSAIDNADVAIGSRSIPGSSVQTGSFRRAVMGRTFSRYVNAITEVRIPDTQCGFKAFRTPVARLLFHCMVIDRFAFDVELLYLARRLHLRVAEVPVHWRDVDGSAVRPVVDPFSMLIDVLRMRMGRQSPLIPALCVSAAMPGGGPSVETVRATLCEALGATLPVVQLRPNATDVLLPLSSADDVRRAGSRVRELLPDSDVHDHMVSVNELIGVGPELLLTRAAAETTSPLAEPPGEMTLHGEEFVTLSGGDSPLHQVQEPSPLPGA